MLIKDNIDTADRMQTTAGSLALVGRVRAKDSFVAQKLREAGAVILGKTNLSEWANIRSSHSVSGWSGRGGQTRNPYALDRNPCGSSSGSGAAIGGQSLRRLPSARKPTARWFARRPPIGTCRHQADAGPDQPLRHYSHRAQPGHGRADGAHGPRRRDPAERAGRSRSAGQRNGSQRGKIAADYTRFLDPNGLRGARIGVARKYFGFSDSVDALMDGVMEEMKRQGAVLVDPADLETHGKFDDSEFRCCSTN